MSIVACALLSTTTLPIAKWQQEIPDVPSGHQPTAPILGNGYVGYMMGTRCQTAHAFGLNQSSINATTLFINSNSNWECHPAKTTAPPVETSKTGTVCRHLHLLYNRAGSRRRAAVREVWLAS